MLSAARIVGYFAGAVIASLFYCAWFVVESYVTMPHSGVGGGFDIGLAIFFWIFEGMGAALLLTALPWYLVIRMYDRFQRFGMFFFPLTGAALVLVIGCVTSSLAPKPLFIEDQTVLEGALIAVQRQGVCMALTGLVFGLAFWFSSEHLRLSYEGA